MAHGVPTGISPTKFAEPVEPLSSNLVGISVLIVIDGKVYSPARGGKQIVYSKSQVSLSHLPLR